MSKEIAILIVDDRQENLLSLEALLQELGVTVIAASSGNEALALLLQYDFALVLLDVQMPEMDGFEVAKLMQANKKTRDIPIIFVTAISMEQKHISRGYEAGAVDYLCKPIDPNILRGKVKIFCDLHESRMKEKLAAEALRQSERQWEMTFDAISDLVSIHDNNFRMIRVNRAACEFFKMEPEELVGSYCYELFHNSSSPCEECPVMTLRKNLQPYSTELVESYWNKCFLVSVSPIFNEKQEFVGVVHIAKDITEKKRLEGQLRQAQKMEAIGTLAGGVAHDFNNILTPIVGFSHLLRMQAVPGSKMEQELKMIFQAAERAGELVKQILSFSRQHNQEMICITIQPIIKEALKLLRSSLPTTIEIQQQIDMTCGAIHADPTQIHQLLMNLCINGAHAMAEKGGVLGVTLSCRELCNEDCQSRLELTPGSYLKLEISDSGCGMGPDILERIFEPYFTTKEKGKGTGMGLAVVHGIVRAHKGHISVDSKPGQGTTFTIFFPMAEEKDSEHDSTQDVRATTLQGAEHVLLVDDEAMIIEVNREILETLGYQVTSETSSERALEIFRTRSNDFDVVITDQTMPGLTGGELARKILEIRPHIPIILCTGFSELVSEEKARDLGVRAYLHKPVSLQDMGATIRRVLEGKEPPDLSNQ